MDLTEVQQQDTFDYALETPAGDVLDVVFTLAGPTHPTRDAYEKRQARKKLREFNRRGKAQVSEDPDEIDQEFTDAAVAMTLGWSNLEVDGAGVAYSADAARKLYADPRFRWIRQAVLDAAADAANFIARRSPG